MISSIALDDIGQKVYVTGRTTSNTTTFLPWELPGGFFDDSHTTNNAFIARFQGANREWATRFGGEIIGLPQVILDKDNNLILVGTALDNGLLVQSTCQGTSGSFPACNSYGTSYLQQFHAGGVGGLGTDGFIAKFSTSAELQWSTLFGGSGNDDVNDVVYNRGDDAIYIVGRTTSEKEVYNDCEPPILALAGFPLCNGGNFFQETLNGTTNNSANGNDGFIARFSDQGELEHSTYFGGAGDDIIYGIAESDGDIYVVGTTNTNIYDGNCQIPTASGFPNCSTGNQYTQAFGGGARDAFVAKLSANNTLLWSTYYGGPEADDGFDISVNSGKDIYIVGRTMSGSMGTGIIPLLSNVDYYFEQDHGDISSNFLEYDNFVAGFNTSEVQILGTYFGGIGEDNVARVYSRTNDRVYLAGWTKSIVNYPENCPGTISPYCQVQTIAGSGTSDGALAQLQYDFTIGFTEYQDDLTNHQFVLYPTTTSDFLYLNTLVDIQGSNIELIVYSIRGVLIQTLSSKVRPNEPLEIDVRELSSGMYIVSVEIDKVTLGSNKFVKID